MRRREYLLAPVCEAALILIVALAAFWSHRPLIFASLGPTAFELVETPKRRTARPYNILAGHTIGICAGFLALLLTHAMAVPGPGSGHMPLARVWAAALAAMLTVFGTMVARAGQPAAISTSLLIALTVSPRWSDAVCIFAAVLLMTLVGEPLRRWRETTMGEGPEAGADSRSLREREPR